MNHPIPLGPIASSLTDENKAVDHNSARTHSTRQASPAEVLDPLLDEILRSLAKRIAASHLAHITHAGGPDGSGDRLRPEKL
jgi:hypothetical protein